ncbi:MAG: sigma-70 family RNA polymerase sigma factor [Gemmataceae bacterium]|nr:sigma-70 family RNA polymerase sigma factor [Gemmataceae bacterium]
MTDVTVILNAIDAGDPHAASQLLPLVYDELRKLAAAKMAGENPNHTLSATALVHEAYLRLVGDQNFENRGHFFAAAAEAMRRILIDRARQRSALKHGGGRQRVPLGDLAQALQTSDGLLAVDEALERLGQVDAGKAELVKLRFFGGLTMPEAAAALGVSLATAERWWTFAKAWLFAELSNSE